MAEFIVQLIPSLFLVAILLIPYLRMLSRVGRSRWWALILLVPLIGFLVLPWIVAFMRWERDPATTANVFD